MIFTRLRKNKFVKVITFIAGLQILFGEVLINLSYGNGPSQPDMEGPSAYNVDNWVDPFTGDFSYSISLMDVGDIPISLNYSAGINMEQEASWVGLGWSLNPGSISRGLRGIPDDFKGDIMVDELNIKPNRTLTASVGAGAEIFGFESANIGLGSNYNLNFTYNNYEGFYITSTFSQEILLGQYAKLGYTLQSESPDEFSDIGVNFGINLEQIKNKIKGDNKAVSDQNKDYLTTSFSRSQGFESITFGAHKNVSINNNVNSSGLHYSKLGIGIGGGYVQRMDQSYTPSLGHNFNNFSLVASGKFGGAFTGVKATVDGKVSYSEQSLDDIEKTKKSSAYGFLYLDNNSKDNTVINDFNREHDGQVYEKTTALPLGYMTYDIFTISSPGIGGSFRAYRNDVGFTQEPTVTVKSNNVSAGYEMALGNITSAGYDIGYVNVASESKSWTDNTAAANFSFKSNQENNSLKEPFYFSFIGEPTFIDESNFMDHWGGEDAIQLDLDVDYTTADVDLTYNKGKGTSSEAITSSGVRRNERVSRNAVIQTFTKQDLLNQETVQETHYSKYKVYPDAQSGHIHKIIVTSTDGTRYVYGLPVYNIEQKDYTFNVSKSDYETEAPEPIDNLVKYSGTQAGTGNQSGKDNYFHCLTTPAYASNYLLTEILSPDYVDVTGNGASQDDLGNYVLYTYGIDKNLGDDVDYFEPNVPLFEWRAPLVSNEFKSYANYYEGLQSDYSDDKGIITTGKKEIWYLNKIETKRYVAEFELSPTTGTFSRHDGYEPLGFNGGFDYTDENLKLQRLDKIILYSRSDYAYEVKKPIKTIHFKYDYSLCKGYPSNLHSAGSEEGKLTLKEIYYTYGESTKFKYSGYSFDYLDNDIVSGYNFPYHYMYSDRWGVYKEQEVGALPNAEFPYVDQNNPEQVNKNAAAWCLYKINTPGGGSITIDYESDDYSYIHDLPATQLTEIYRFAENPFEVETWSTNLYNGGVLSHIPNQYIIFKLDHPIPNTVSPGDANQRVREDYILYDDKDPFSTNGICNNLYFKLKTNVNSLSDAVTEYDYVTGYAMIETYDLEPESGYAGAILGDGGAMGPSTDYNYGYIKLKYGQVKHDGGTLDVNRISKAGWQFCMDNYRENIIDETAAKSANAETFINVISNFTLIGNLIGLFQNPNEKMISNEYAKVFIPGEAWLRLKNPYGKKLGGGHRVSRITITDSWEIMTLDDGPTTTYAKEYFYTNKDESSTGVAAYEPSVGGDENPKHSIRRFGYDPDKLYSYDLYQEGPFGEEFFPAAAVGYEKVIVKNYEIENVHRTATGSTMYEYFTTKDYPYITDETEFEPDIISPEFSLSTLLPVPQFKSYYASQGFKIETNDMFGKLKKVSNFAEDETQPYSSVEYVFKEDDNGNLNSLVPVINAKNQIENKEIGIKIDQTLDLRTNNSTVLGGNAAFNIDVFLLPVIPVTTFTVVPSATMQFERLGTAVITKVVHRTGLLDKIIAKEEGSTIEHYNELWSEKDGAVLLTSTQNEFNDRYYSLNMPAFWHYEQLGFAYENIGFNFEDTEALDKIEWSNGKIKDDDLKEILVPGDEILTRIQYDTNADGLINPGNDRYIRTFVYEKSSGGSVELFLIDEEGKVPEFEYLTYTVKNIQGKIIRSGKRNQSGFSMGSIVSRELPFNEAGTQLAIGPGKKIIAASASEYTNGWNMLCQPTEVTETTEICNCNSALTEVGLDAVNFFSSIFKLEGTYNSEEIIVHEFPDGEDEIYYFGFTPLLNEQIIYEPGGEISTLNCLFEDEDISMHFINEENQPRCDMLWDFPEAVVWEDITDEMFAPGSDLQVEISVPESPIGACSDISDMLITITYFNASGILQTITGSSTISCMTLRNCSTIEYTPPYCYGALDQTVNPYLKGLLGVWSKKLDYAYLVDRNKDSYTDVNSINLRSDGYYDTFEKFWEFTGGQWQKALEPKGWQWTTQATKRDIAVGGIETFNPLDIYSSSIFGMNNTAPEMVCDNATFKHIGFESFEDDYYTSSILEKDCNVEHFDLNPSVGEGEITSRWAHTGNYSLKIQEEGVVSYMVDEITIDNLPRDDYPKPFKISAADCLPVFSPDKDGPEKTYLLTYWVKETDNLNDYVGDEGSALIVSVLLDDADPGTINLVDEDSYQISNPIEGWRRHSLTFTVDANAEGTFAISFTNNATSPYPIYVDDVRVHPNDAIAACYVYDMRTQRLMTELDANHFATFYEYDEDGQLIRIKKETERGIMTIQEGRNNIVKREF